MARVRIKFKFGDDVQLYIPGWSGAWVERLRKYCFELIDLMIYARKCDHLIARMMRIPHAKNYDGAQMTFSRDSYDFRLWFDGERWILNFARTPARGPKPPRSRRSAEAKSKAPARKSAGRARPQSVRRPPRKALKRLALKMYKTVRSSFRRIERAASMVVEPLTKSRRIVDYAQRVADDCVRLVQHLAADAAAFGTNCAERLARKSALRNFRELASLGADGMRLERVVWGAELGLPMRFSTYFPPRPNWDWAAMFGEREESELFVT